MSWFSGLSLSRTRTVLGLHIEGNAVDAFLLRDTTPYAEVLWQHRAESKITNPKETRATLSTDALAALVQELLAEGIKQHPALFTGEHIAEVVCILHAPWSTSRTYEHTASFEKEKEITPALIKQYLNEAIASEKKDAIYERSALRIEVNGYPTMHPEGKWGVRVRIVACVSEEVSGVVAKIKEKITAALPRAKCTIRSATFMTLSVLQSIAIDSPHYTLAHVGSEETTFSLVRRGSLVAQETAPVGWRTIVRKLSEKYGTSPDEALSRFKMALEETCTYASCKEILSSLADIMPETIAAYGGTFSSIQKISHLPGVLVLMAPKDFTQWYVDVFTKIDFTPFTDTTQPFNVQALAPEQFKKTAVFAPEVTPSAEAALIATFIHNRR